MSRSRRVAQTAGSVALLTVLLGRWLALGVTAYLSLFHWMRGEYLAFSHVWQYGLPFLDPRVAAALLWWLLHSLFLIFLLYPAARWLAGTVPDGGPWRPVAWLALALGLGTRGIVGALVIRAAASLPLRPHPFGQEAQGWLTEVHTARWALLAVEAWWLLPALVVALRLGGLALEKAGRGWCVPLLLAVYALTQPLDAPYLLTGGGPRGATMSLPYLAFREGWGREEFGYASVLAVLLSLCGMAAAPALRRVLETPGASRPAPGARTGRGWLAALAALATPVVLAWVVAPPERLAPVSGLATTAVSLGVALAAGAWTAALTGPWWERLTRAPRGLRSALLAPAFFPSLVWTLPAVRALSRMHPSPGWLAAPVGLVWAAPYLYAALGSYVLARRREVPERRAVLAAGCLAAWGTWTDLPVPLMLAQKPHPFQQLPSEMAWALSTHLWSSPLAVPGWPVAWGGGSLLALTGVWALLGDPGAHADPSPTEPRGACSPELTASPSRAR